MRIFSLFKKEKSMQESSVDDEVMDFLLKLFNNNEDLKKEVIEIEKIKTKPIFEKDYSQIYLSLEQKIISQDIGKGYLSRSIIKGKTQVGRPELRQTIREKFEISELNEQFRIIFLEESAQKATEYKIMLNKILSLLPKNKKESVSQTIKEVSSKSKIKGIRVINEKITFSETNKKQINRLTSEELGESFKKIFFAIYHNISGYNQILADKIMSLTYSTIKEYGYPITLFALMVLPVKSKEEYPSAMLHYACDYLIDLTKQNDLIRPEIERIKNAENLNTKEKEKVFFEVYTKLENFVTTHKPPAVVKSITKKEIRLNIKEKIDIDQLTGRFNILFLSKENQIIGMFISLYNSFFKRAFPFLKCEEIKRFIDEKTKGTTLQGINMVGDTIDFSIIKKDSMEKNISEIRCDLSGLLFVLFKECEKYMGEKKAEKEINYSYTELKDEYGGFPTIDDFIRGLPEGILEYQKKMLLAPKAAEKVLECTIESINKDAIKEEIAAIKRAKELPTEQQTESFFTIYLNIQNYIIEERPRINGKEISLQDLKEYIRTKIDISDLEDKFQLLFLHQDEMLVKLTKDLVKECILNFIDRKALVESVRVMTKDDSFLKEVITYEDGTIDFEPFFRILNTKDVDRLRILKASLSKVIRTLFDKAKGVLGEIQAKRLFETSYKKLQERYGANLLQILKVIPPGILEAEKFELLSKEEIEKTAKEMVKIDVMKGEFMNIAAHELKTPLVPIITYLEMMMQDKRLQPDQLEKIKICLSSAKRESELVSDILDISKLEAGTMKMEVKILDLVDVLKEATEGMRPSVELKKLEFKVDIPTNIPRVNIDRRKVTQVVTNLIGNSTKFTEIGSITVKAEIRKKDILISVADTGMGISEENTRKLFTKFFQADTSARRKQGGTGLGLAICKGIVEGHKGKIWVESKLDKGTTFFFTIPVIE